MDSESILFDYDGPIDGQGLPHPWSSTVSSGRLQAQVRELGGQGNHRAMWLRSEKSSFFLANPAKPFDPSVYSIMRWSWKAVKLPTNGDVRKNRLLFGENLNDQALQVLVVFEDKKILSYVWDTTSPVGTELDEPSIAATVKTRVIDSGSDDIDKIINHEINILEEYKRRFGHTPKRVVGIILQSNSNHTGTLGEGLIGPITVSKR